MALEITAKSSPKHSYWPSSVSSRGITSTRPFRLCLCVGSLKRLWQFSMVISQPIFESSMFLMTRTLPLLMKYMYFDLLSCRVTRVQPWRTCTKVFEAKISRVAVSMVSKKLRARQYWMITFSFFRRGSLMYSLKVEAGIKMTWLDSRVFTVAVLFPQKSRLSSPKSDLLLTSLIVLYIRY